VAHTGLNPFCSPSTGNLIGCFDHTVVALVAGKLRR